VAQQLNSITRTAFKHQYIETNIRDTTDTELMERIQSRDERALETLIKRLLCDGSKRRGRMIAQTTRT
jgi:hypothetical protein